MWNAQWKRHTSVDASHTKLIFLWLAVTTHTSKVKFGAGQTFELKQLPVLQQMIKIHQALASAASLD